MNKKLVLALIATSATLIGCGDSSSDGGSTTTPTAPQATTLKAIDGYLARADVYVDRNGNDVADPEERIGDTDLNGEITIPAEDQEYNLLLVADPDKTIDSDTNAPVAGAFTFKAKAGSSVITPYTTASERSNMTLDELAASLNVPTSAIEGDYIVTKNNGDSNSEVTHALARFMTLELIENGTTPDTSDLADATDALKEGQTNGLDLASIILKEDPLQPHGFALNDNASLKFKPSILANKDWTMYSLENGMPEINTKVRFNFTDITTGTYCQDTECKNFTIDAHNRLQLQNTDWTKYMEIIYATYNEKTDVYTFIVMTDKGDINWMDNSTVDNKAYTSAPAVFDSKKFDTLYDSNEVEGGVNVVLASYQVTDTEIIVDNKEHSTKVVKDMPNGQQAYDMVVNGHSVSKVVVRQAGQLVLTALYDNNGSASDPYLYQIDSLNRTSLELMEQTWNSALSNR